MPRAETVPRAPRGLGPAGRAAWYDAWRSAPWLRPLDRLAVELLARAFDERAALAAILDRDGRIVAGSKGQPVNHPALAASASVTGRISEALAGLGLTPVGRRRLGIEVQDPDPPTPFEALVGGDAG